MNLSTTTIFHFLLRKVFETCQVYQCQVYFSMTIFSDGLHTSLLLADFQC